MPGIKMRYQTSSSRKGAMFTLEKTCEDCGCLALTVPNREDLYRCSGRCGYISDPIPMSELKGKTK
jgi:hypothetical protein